MIKSWNSTEIEARIRRGAMTGVIRAIGRVEDRAVRFIMEGPKTGKIYRRRGVVHQASAPGEAPANDTGRLVASRSIQLFPEDVRARLKFGTDYAPHLEHGTLKMAARPYARRSLMEERSGIISDIATEIRAVLK